MCNPNKCWKLQSILDKDIIQTEQLIKELCGKCPSLVTNINKGRDDETM